MSDQPRPPPPPDAEAGKNSAPASWDEVFPDPLEVALRLVAERIVTHPSGVRAELVERFGGWVACRVRGLVEEIVRGGGEPMTDPQPEPAEPTPPEPQAEPVPTPPPEPALPAAPAPVRPPAGDRVLTAADFKPLTLDEALARARRTTVAQVREWHAAQEHTRSLLFDAYRDECSEVAVVRDPAAVPDPLWAIGDVHADILALANIVAYAERETQGEPAFLFLGDFVDRGRYDHETLLFVFGLAMQYPGRVCVVPGNHDTDLRWAEKPERFAVTIYPAEYCDRLNALLESGRESDREHVELGLLAIDFWKARPKAVFLPDGTMFAHGGFPHTDLQKVEADPRRNTPERVLLREVSQLGDPNAVSDFLWARLAESPKKRPNRHGGRGHEFGWKDFAQFCRIMTEHVGVPVRRLVRGHDHVAARWHLPADYAEHGCPVLTVNAMGWRLDGEPEPADAPHPFPVVARHAPGQLPLVVRVPLDPAEVDRAAAVSATASPESGLPVAEEVPFAEDDFPGGVAIERQEPPPRTERMTDNELGGGV